MCSWPKSKSSAGFSHHGANSLPLVEPQRMMIGHNNTITGGKDILGGLTSLDSLAKQLMG